MGMRIFVVVMWFLALAVAAAVAIIPNFMIIENHEDKMLHVTGFCLLMIVPAIVVYRLGTVALCAAVLFALGAGMEILQQTVAGRESSLEDITANAAGIALGLVIGYLFRSEYNPSEGPIFSRRLD